MTTTAYTDQVGQDRRLSPAGSVPVSAWVIGGAGVAAAVGSFLPWAVVRAPLMGQMTKSGMEGDGVYTLILGGLLVLLAKMEFRCRRSNRALGGIAAVVGAVIAVTAVIDIVDVTRWIADLSVEGRGYVSVSIGLWVTALAGLVGVIGGLLAAVEVTIVERHLAAR